LGKKLDIVLSYKDETRNPTGSFKDRAAAVMLSAAKYMGQTSITTASSGNAAGAISLYSALAGIKSFVFMFKPSEQKLLQTLSYGATVLIVDTKNEARVLEVAEQASDAFGWALLNTTSAANPFVAEGYKTIAYELYEQGHIPDWIAVPVASGSLLIGTWQGFRELKEIGLVNRLPRLLGVQPAGSAPITAAFSAGEKTVKPIRQADTIATALSLEDPGVSGIETLRAVKESDGTMIAVEDDQLIRLSREFPKKEGIFAEASGAISVAGVVQARRENVIGSRQSVCCIITGGGLKDPSVFRGERAVEPILVPDALKGVKAVLNERGILNE
jgi:threonine synthase